MEREEAFFEMETRKHQQQVAKFLINFAMKLLERASVHDNSKLEHPEREIFIEYTPKLKGLTYGSKEYKDCLKEMRVAVDHHQANNKHHPEYNSFNGIALGHSLSEIEAMDLVDIVEMLCDWFAATQRHDDGDIGKSIDINEKRFGISKQLCQIFRNTIQQMN